MAFVVPAACFAYLFLLSLKGGRKAARPPQPQSKPNEPPQRQHNPLSRITHHAITNHSPMKSTTDKRIVMTLDAGGTNFRFSAMRGNKPVTETVALPSNGDNLDQMPGQHRRGLHPR